MPKEKHNLRINPAPAPGETNYPNPGATPFHTPVTPTTPSSSTQSRHRSRLRALFHRKPKSYSEAPAPRAVSSATSIQDNYSDRSGDLSETSEYESEPPTPTTPGLNDLTLQIPNLSLEDREDSYSAGTPTQGSYVFPPASSSTGRHHVERTHSEPSTPTDYSRQYVSQHTRVPSNISDSSTGSASGQRYRKQYTIIWDLGDTMLRRKIFGLVKSVSISDFAKYTLYDWQNPFFIKHKVFDILDLLDVREKKSLTHLKRWPIKSEGRVLPPIMLEWLAGIETGHSIMKKAMAKIKELEKTYLNEREVRILENSVKVLFDPILLSTHMRPIEKMVRILDMCYNSKYVKDMVILSNWDNISFNELYKMPHVQQVFKYFKKENIVVSANINMIKPDPDIYNYVLKTYGLKADECIVIDDDENNIKTAAGLGFHAIKVVKGDYGQVYRRLVELRALPNPKRRGSIYPVDEEPLTSTYKNDEEGSSQQDQQSSYQQQQQAVQ